MIVTCPACGKRYRLPDDAVPAEGKIVRCAACREPWLVTPAVPPEPEPPSEPQLVPEPEPAAGTLVPPATLWEPDWEEVMPRRRRPWIPVGLVAAVAIGAAAIVYFLPVLPGIDLARLGLPKIDLPAIKLPEITLPVIDLPPLDLAQIPVVGPDIDRWINPPKVPPSPLRISVTADRRALTNGTHLLVLNGTVANPSASRQPVPAIDATLAFADGRVAYRWRIDLPVAFLGPAKSVPFEAVAANYPADARALRLRFAKP